MERSSSLTWVALVIALVALGISFWYNGCQNNNKPPRRDQLGSIKVTVHYVDSTMLKRQRVSQQRMLSAPEDAPASASASTDTSAPQCDAILDLATPSTLQGYGLDKTIRCKPPYACFTADEPSEFSNIVFGSYLLRIIHCDGETYYYMGDGKATNDPSQAVVITIDREHPTLNLDFRIEILAQ